jgi:hypothetical protein
VLASVVAIGVGSRNNDQVPPTASVEPSAQPSASPSAPPASPSPTPPTIKFNEEISVVNTADGEVRVTVYELSGLLESIGEGDPGAVPDPDEDGIGAANDPTDETVVTLMVGGCPSQDEYLVTVDVVAGTIVAETSECEGDTLGVQWAIELHFSEPVDAGSLVVTLREQNAGDPGG